jgi:hypothetical protein
MTCRCCCLNANLMVGSPRIGGRGPKSWLPNTRKIGLTQCSKVALLSSMVRQPQTRFCRRRLHKCMGDSWGINGSSTGAHQSI